MKNNFLFSLLPAFVLLCVLNRELTMPHARDTLRACSVCVCVWYFIERQGDCEKVI